MDGGRRQQHLDRLERGIGRDVVFRDQDRHAIANGRRLLAAALENTAAGERQQRHPDGGRLHQLDHCAALSRSEEHTSELQSLMRISYAVFCLKKKKYSPTHTKQLTLSY